MNKAKEDPIKRFVDKDSKEELSPMNPPDAFDLQNIDPVPYEEMHPYLQKLMDEHEAFTAVLNGFENALLKWKENHWVFSDEIDRKLKNFFEFVDENVPEHNKKEEKQLFPLLHKKLVESGEHNSKDASITGINIMEDEHIKVAQASAIVLNFLGLGSRLADKRSKEITFEAAFEQGIAIVETMKLHIFREDKVLFPQAMKFFAKNDLDKIDQADLI